jgi:5-methylcytosine-specific restriction endonuclease McrA
VSYQESRDRPRLAVENPDQAARITAWWAAIEEAVTAAGGIRRALDLVAPGAYYEDLLFALVDLDWNRFPELVRKDGRLPESKRADGVKHSIFREKLSKWANAVKAAASGPPPEEPPPAAGRHRRPGNEDTKPQGWPAAQAVNPAVQNVVQLRSRRVPDGKPQGEERKRSSIPRSVKQEVWRRDDGRCRKCGINDDESMRRTGEHLQYDHIWPWSLNGADTAGNIQLLCGTCNRTKSSKFL